MNNVLNTTTRKKRAVLLVVVIFELLIAIGLLLCFLIPQLRCYQALSTNEKLFNLNCSDVQEIRFEDDFFGSYGSPDERVAIEHFVNTFNDFTYNSAEPVYFENPAYTHYSVAFTIDGETRKYRFTLNSITVDNVRYYSDNDNFFAGFDNVSHFNMPE